MWATVAWPLRPGSGAVPPVITGRVTRLRAEGGGYPVGVTGRRRRGGRLHGPKKCLPGRYFCRGTGSGRRPRRGKSRTSSAQTIGTGAIATPWRAARPQAERHLCPWPRHASQSRSGTRHALDAFYRSSKPPINPLPLARWMASLFTFEAKAECSSMAPKALIPQNRKPALRVRVAKRDTGLTRHKSPSLHRPPLPLVKDSATPFVPH